MDKQICVPIPTEDFLNLARFLQEQGSGLDPVGAVIFAIDYWIENARDKPDIDITLRRKRFVDSRGYTWKHKNNQLFLPHDTEIRMRYKDKYHYAKVEGDQIIYDGQSVSPAILANTITGTSRNAWRDLWIKRPGDAGWALADDLRGRKVVTTLADLGL